MAFFLMIKTLYSKFKRQMQGLLILIIALLSLFMIATIKDDYNGFLTL